MNGESGDVDGIFDDEPMCMFSTVSVSSHAGEERVPEPVLVVHRRQPEVERVLGERDRVAALVGAAAHLGGRELARPTAG